MRSLNAISKVVSSLRDGRQRVWEPFSGSSVVSQSLASHGHQVWSCDALISSTTFAAATLGVDRNDTNESLEAQAKEVVEYARSADVSIWEPWLVPEREAVAERDGAKLLDVGLHLPQRWRTEGATAELLDYFQKVDSRSAELEKSADGLISTTYAGTYFGLGQALHLELLREGINQATGEKASWQRNALLAALAHAASNAVFSPGKHFAQPHRIRKEKNLSFHARRALQDRSVSIFESFAQGVEQVAAAACSGLENHRAEHRLCETVSVDDLKGWGVDTVYADPPYTAQQYSRFYHLLETLTSSIPPRLQFRAGEVTRGLYPEGRYLSPFSSRLRAPSAFQSLIETTGQAGANLVVSYSAGMGSATGNARMVTLEQIVEWMSHQYGSQRVTVKRVGDLTYRQFNNSDRAISERDDPEFLIVGRTPHDR